MDFLRSIPPWLRHALIGIGLFLAGGLIAFGYSYRPLHGALVWQVEQLETRLDERNREILKLSDQLAREASDAATRIDPDTLTQVERELDKTKKVLAQAEKDLAYVKTKRKSAEASAAQWRERYEALRDATPPVPAAPAPTTSPGPSTPARPASPATATPGGRSRDPDERGMLGAGDPAPLDAPPSP